jgi:hypothetical protein
MEEWGRDGSPLASARRVVDCGRMNGTTIGLAAGGLELAVSAVWFHLLRRVRIPDDRRPFLAAHATALVLGVAALLLGAGTLGTVFAWFGIVGAAVFIGLAAQAGQLRSRPAAVVGGPIVDFVLPDHTGKPFDLATLRGRPFLLKFFRGHW